MRRVPFAPSVAPETEGTIYLVLDNFGAIGRAYRETDLARANQQSVIEDLVTGQYNDPLYVVAFNVNEGWSRDVSEDIAEAVIALATEHGRLSQSTVRFCERHTRQPVREGLLT